MIGPGPDATLITPPFAPQWWGMSGAPQSRGRWCPGCAASHEGPPADDARMAAGSEDPWSQDLPGVGGFDDGTRDEDLPPLPPPPAPGEEETSTSDRDECALGPDDDAFALAHPGYSPPAPPPQPPAPENARLGSPAPGGLNSYLIPPPFSAIHQDTRDCFTHYYGSGPLGIPSPLTEYPPYDCPPPPLRRDSSCVFPDESALAGIRVTNYRAPEDLWHERECHPTWFDPSQTVIQRNLERLLRVGMWVLRENLDVVEWACCLMRGWSPQWNANPPYAYEGALYRAQPAGVLSKDQQWTAWRGRQSGGADLGQRISSYVAEGRLHLVLISEGLEPSGSDFTRQEDCVPGEAGASVVHIHEADALDLHYYHAVVIPAHHPRWEAYRRAFSQPTGGSLEQLCIGVRAASSILHELVHIYGYPWATHLDNGCLDPCNMVQTAFMWGMGQRWPCLLAAPCCAQAMGADVFMGRGGGYDAC